LIEVEKRREDLGDGSRRLLDAAVDGCVGPMAQLFDVPAEYEPAVLAALGTNIDALVMTNMSTLTAAVQFVEEQAVARVALAHADLSEMPPRSKLPKGIETLGFLMDLLAPRANREVMAHLMADPVLVADFEVAVALVTQGWSGRVVTMSGQRLDGDIIAYAGSAGDETGPLGRRREIKELGESLEKLNGEHADLAASLDALRTAQIDARQGLDNARTASRNAAIKRAEEQREYEQLDRQRALLAQSVERFEQDRTEIETQLGQNEELEKDAKT
jgi:chromosome segregation protein